MGWLLWKRFGGYIRDVRPFLIRGQSITSIRAGIKTALIGLKHAQMTTLLKQCVSFAVLFISLRLRIYIS